jgi:hypothetical protein
MSHVMQNTTSRLVLVIGLLGVLASGCGDSNANNNGRCADLPQPGDPIATPDEPGRVPCALRPPHLR